MPIFFASKYYVRKANIKLMTLGRGVETLSLFYKYLEAIIIFTFPQYKHEPQEHQTIVYSLGPIYFTPQ